MAIWLPFMLSLESSALEISVRIQHQVTAELSRVFIYEGLLFAVLF